MKKILILILLISNIAFSQDIIVKKNREEIKSKIIEITSSDIKFKEFEFQDGPTRNVPITEVFMIIYENGKRETFNQESSKNTYSNQNNNEFRKKRLNLDLIAIGENGPTSISYEIINEDGSRGIEFPVSVYFNGDGVVGYTIGANLKYYVSSKQGKGFYVGPSLGLGAFDWYNYDYYYDTSTDFSVYLGVKLGYQFQISELFGINLAGNAGGISNFDDFDGAYSFNIGLNFSF